MAASTRPSSPSLNDRDSQSIPLPPPAALRAHTAHYRSSYRINTPPVINTRPPSPVSRQEVAAPLDPISSPSPSAFDSSTVSPHPLTSILLSELSPPASPAPSTASYPRSGSRSRINSTAGPVGRAGRGRTRTRRRTSISSTTSNDGSAPGEGRADEEEESGTSSGEDNSNLAQGGLVMPSLTLERRQSVASSSRGRSSQIEGEQERRFGRNVKLLILGKTGEDRRTLSALLSNDEDLRRQPSSVSVDLSYSILSSVRSHHARSSSEGSSLPTSDFVSSGSCGTAVTLSYPLSDHLSHEELVCRLRRPLEQLEAKLESTFPSTESLASLVDTSGVGGFDASLFLFSSPPLPCEVAIARSISHLLPILPVLILPPSPTSKPQKTTALSNAVIQQLESAGVRWLPVGDLDRRESKSPTRRGSSKQNEIGGGPLTMLPHDLFVQHPPSETQSVSSHRDHSSTPTTSFPSPTSEPTSLTSSQELPPLSPTFTSASSYYRTSSSRASSARSLSPSSTTGRNTANLHHLTLLDLHRLRRILHAEGVSTKIRRARTLTFLEWRDVEVAARGIEMVAVESLPREWEEKAVEWPELAQFGRRGLDFSKRVAERRKTLGCKQKGRVVKERDMLQNPEEQDDGDVLDMDEEAQEEEPGRRPSFSTTLQDPTTPKPCFRHLPSSSSSFAPLSTPTPTFSNVSSASSSSESSPSNKSGSSARSPSPSYFPPFPVAPLSASLVSIPSTTDRSDHAGSASSSSSSTTSNVSISLMKPCNPFHFPSFLHLVGLNLRLALFHPVSSGDSPRSINEQKQVDTSSRNSTGGKASQEGPWWKTIAVFSVVFAAGVVAGVQVVERLDRSIA
ncbi:hypothetical protein JCM5350_007218 [Sporobolomyces pararoseus]